MESELLDSKFHCSSLFHLVRLIGRGSGYVVPLYYLSMRVSWNKVTEKNERFFPDMAGVASYFDCHRNQLYLAAGLLENSGWWEVLEEVPGKAVQYHPRNHEDWVTLYGGAQCCKKLVMPWDSEQQDPLGQQLYAVTGGAKFFPQVLTGWRNKSGLTDEQIVAAAKRFMETADHRKKDARFRKNLGDFIRKSNP